MPRTFNFQVRFHAPVQAVSVSRQSADDRQIQQQQEQERQPPPEPATPQPTAADLTALLQSIADQLDELEQARAQNHSELQELAIELGVQVASHIVRQKVEADEFPLQDLVAQAAEQLVPCQQLLIKVNPADAAKLREFAEQAFADLAERADVVETDQLPLGACLVTADGQGVISDLGERLQAIRTTLLQGVEHARIERRKSLATGGALRRFPDRRKLA